jgi:hypothetical protein
MATSSVASPGGTTQPAPAVTLLHRGTHDSAGQSGVTASPLRNQQSRIGSADGNCRVAPRSILGSYLEPERTCECRRRDRESGAAHRCASAEEQACSRRCAPRAGCEAVRGRQFVNASRRRVVVAATGPHGRRQVSGSKVRLRIGRTLAPLRRASASAALARTTACRAERACRTVGARRPLPSSAASGTTATANDVRRIGNSAARQVTDRMCAGYTGRCWGAGYPAISRAVSQVCAQFGVHGRRHHIDRCWTRPMETDHRRARHGRGRPLQRR